MKAEVLVQAQVVIEGADITEIEQKIKDLVKRKEGEFKSISIISANYFDDNVGLVETRDMDNGRTVYYKPLCPRGYEDCVGDPAYIKATHPNWYHKLYGDKTPEEALEEEGGCLERFREDPQMEAYCYDDEDK